MTTQAEEVYVVEHLVQDEMGFWWKPTFTHTNLAVSMGKMLDQGPRYIGTREACRLRVYKGTPTTINRSNSADALDKLLKASSIVSHGRAQAKCSEMVAHICDAYVAIGDKYKYSYEPVVERNLVALGESDLKTLRSSALSPVEALNREFEYADPDEVLKAKEALRMLNDMWVPKRQYKDSVGKVKKPVQPLQVVEQNRPCQVCGTTLVKDFGVPGDELCTRCSRANERVMHATEEVTK